MSSENLVTTEIIADLLSVTVRRVQQLAKEGIIPAAKTKPYAFDLYEVAQTYIKYLNDKVVGKENRTHDVKQAEEEKLRAEADWKMAKAKMSEIQLAELEGNMHRADDVIEVMNALVYAVRSNILSLPGRLAMDVVEAKTANEASAIIRAECNNILNDLSNYKYNPDEFRRRVKERQGKKEESEDEED